MNNDRLKFYVEFPIAQTWEEAVKCIVDGGSCWQEDSNDWPACGGFDDLECFLENFPEEEKDECDFSLFDVHMVPKGEEDSIAEPFKVGEEVWASKDITRVALDETVDKGRGFTIERICLDGTLIFDKPLKSNGKDIKLGFNPSDFIRDGKDQPTPEKKIFILADFEEGIMDYPMSCFNSLEEIKEHLKDVKGLVWSDEDEDFAQSSNWDIEAVDIETGQIMYGIYESNLEISSK